MLCLCFFFFKQKTAYEMRISAGVQTCALPISGGHAVRFSEGMAAATGITIMSLLLGAAAAAAGAPDAAMAIMAGGQQAAMGKFLAFSRTQESSAAQAGASFRSEERRGGKECVSPC